MRLNGTRLGCCASLGSSYGFGGFVNHYDVIAEHPDGWTEDALGEMVQRIKKCGFAVRPGSLRPEQKSKDEEVIPWTDYPPGEILPADPESVPLAAEDAKTAQQRIVCRMN